MPYVRMLAHDYRYFRRIRGESVPRACASALREGWLDFAFMNLPRRFWS